MTELEKQQFFVMHIGQEMFWEREDKEIVHMTLTPSDFGFLMERNGWLELKPLESITDEDLIYLDKVVSGGYSGSAASGRVIIKYYDYRADSSDITDTLRQLGYLLPWGKYSVDQLIKEGVVNSPSQEET